MDNYETWSEIVNELQGSCRGLWEVLQDYQDSDQTVGNYIELQDNLEFLEFLDSHIMNCSQCGWWDTLDNIDFVDSEVICLDCLEENEQ
jgi:hypothetical protein